MAVTYHHPLGHHSFPEPRAPTRTWFNQSHQEIRRVSLGAPALVQGLASATAQPAFPFALPWRQQAAGKGPTSCTRLLSQPQHLGCLVVRGQHGPICLPTPFLIIKKPLHWLLIPRNTFNTERALKGTQFNVLLHFFWWVFLNLPFKDSLKQC